VVVTVVPDWCGVRRRLDAACTHLIGEDCLMTSATDLVGHTLGAYELVEIIGSGAMATVFKAFQPTLDRWVAIKVLHYRETGARIRFQREAKAIAKLRHRNSRQYYYRRKTTC